MNVQHDTFGFWVVGSSEKRGTIALGYVSPLLSLEAMYYDKINPFGSGIS
jgi:hypothetical protein